MSVRGKLSVHIVDQIKKIAHHLENVHAAGAHPVLGACKR